MSPSISNFFLTVVEHLARRIWKTFDADFGDVISEMKRHLDSISPAVQLAAIKQSHQQHEGISMRKYLPILHG